MEVDTKEEGVKRGDWKGRGAGKEERLRRRNVECLNKMPYDHVQVQSVVVSV
jgi:hypothetical protein